MTTMHRYVPRTESALSQIARELATAGIAGTQPIFSSATIERINGLVDPILELQQAKARAYVTVDDFARLGLIDTILGGAMKQLLLTITPDPVLYHCHIYEIAANNKNPHIFGDSISGWHRDPDSELYKGDATHTSIFVYLSDVGANDGPFEFAPSDPTNWVRSTTPAVAVTGPCGLTFAWNRSYYHRASPNRGPVRRRLLKLSIQPNAFPSAHLGNAKFRSALAEIPSGDPYFDVLFGRYQGGVAPTLAAPPAFATLLQMSHTGTIGIPDHLLAKKQARERLKLARRWLSRKITRSQVEEVAYD